MFKTSQKNLRLYCLIVMSLLLGIIVYSIGGYNVIRGLYDMYHDIDKIKNYCTRRQTIINQYKMISTDPPKLTESTYKKIEDDFTIC